MPKPLGEEKKTSPRTLISHRPKKKTSSPVFILCYCHYRCTAYNSIFWSAAVWKTLLLKQSKMPAAGVVEELSFTWDSDMNEDAYDTLDDDQVLKGCFPIHSRHPNAHGGLHSHPNSTFQPLSHRLQMFDARIWAAPLEVRKIYLMALKLKVVSFFLNIFW